jgi:hypothetical protein
VADNCRVGESLSLAPQSNKSKTKQTRKKKWLQAEWIDEIK